MMKMKNAENYVFGPDRVPPWVGDALSDIQYDAEGNLSRAIISTPHGKRTVKQGDVLMRIDNAVVLLKKQDAKKYGVTK